jgi:hypothetical protein
MPLNYQTPPPPQVDLRKIATRQRAIMLCILGEIVLFVVMAVAPTPLRPLVALGIGCLGITASVFTFMLGTSVYGTGQGIMWGILSLIPYVGIIPLLIVNTKATNILRRHNIKVGLLGASPGQFS